MENSKVSNLAATNDASADYRYHANEERIENACGSQSTYENLSVQRHLQGAVTRNVPNTKTKTNNTACITVTIAIIMSIALSACGIILIFQNNGKLEEVNKTSNLHEDKLDLLEKKYEAFDQNKEKMINATSAVLEENKQQMKILEALVAQNKEQMKKLEEKLEATVQQNKENLNMLGNTLTEKFTYILQNQDCSLFDTNKTALIQNDTGGVFAMNSPKVGYLEAYCDLKTDGGRWIVFQRRYNGMVNFVSRKWDDYVSGFGDPANEFWMGLDKLYRLTTGGTYELRIDLEDWEGNKTYATYSNFFIGSASTKYKLNLGTYSGDAGDSLTFHNRMKFTTPDQDNDMLSSNCAANYGGGWWFNNCLTASLNGQYFKQGHGNGAGRGIVWGAFRGDKYSLKFSEMKFRRKI